MNSFIMKLKGLMFKKDLSPDTGFFFDKASSIHTCFMRFPIDVVYLETLDTVRYQIVKIVRNIKPWRLSGSLEADALIEFKSPSPVLNSIRKNDILLFD